MPPDDPAVAAQVETIRASLARAFALEQAGAFAEATTLADAALADARALGYAPLVAEASTRIGHLADSNGKYDVAETTLREAYADAIANNHPLNDGNKRTAFMCAYTFLAANEWEMYADEAEVVVMTVGLADKSVPAVKYADWLRDHSKKG